MATPAEGLAFHDEYQEAGGSRKLYRKALRLTPTAVPRYARGVRNGGLQRSRRALVAGSALAALVGLAAPAGADGSPTCTRANGKLTCWGGELVVREASLDHPELLGRAPKAATAASFRHRHACAIAGGALTCWGDNERGQLGDGTSKGRASPTRVAVRGRFTQLALGWGHTCALRSDAKVFCWGGGHPKPAPIALPADVVELTAGGQHSCARRRDGSVWCWGSGHYGQLGDGTRADRALPVRVRGLDDATSVAAGLYHTCATRADGAAWCWGNGAGGEYGAAARLLVPSKVTGSEGALEVAAGDYGLVVRRRGKPPLACDYSLGADQAEDNPTLRCRPVPHLVVPDVNASLFGSPENLRLVDAITLVR
jgi:regulator of chromosome condensation (RCC1) repeat-containing protein